VLRINARYLDEFVEGFDVCPYARGARQQRAVERRVLLDEKRARATIAELEALDQVAIGLLIFPRFEGPFAHFDAFCTRLREARGKGPFALAPFHPDAPYGSDTPAQMMMFFRRAPDPTLQLVRFSALDAVKGGRPDKLLFDFSAAAFAELDKRAAIPPTSERIARDNFARAQQDLPRLQSILDDIRADRARSYARFGARPGDHDRA